MGMQLYLMSQYGAGEEDEEMSAAQTFQIRVSEAHMPTTCKFGRYKHVAVMAVEPGYTVHEISDRRPGRSVVAVWRKVNRGKTDRCGFAIALAEARERLAAERQMHINDLVGQ